MADDPAKEAPAERNRKLGGGSYFLGSRAGAGGPNLSTGNVSWQLSRNMLVADRVSRRILRGFSLTAHTLSAGTRLTPDARSGDSR